MAPILQAKDRTPNTHSHRINFFKKGFYSWCRFTISHQDFGQKKAATEGLYGTLMSNSPDQSCTLKWFNSQGLWLGLSILLKHQTESKNLEF
jgi:hypothetical protein